MATREELITLFGDDFGEVLVGLDQLPREVLELLDTTMEKMLFDADVFTSRIAKTVGTQTSAGVATSSIEDILANDMGEEGRIFGELRNTVKESLVEGINQTSRAGAFQAYDPDEDTLFTWVTVAGHRICKDCLPRGGERKTLRDWEAAGVPASGWSICGGYCYCILDPSGKMSPRVQLEEREGGLRIQEKGATIRSKEIFSKTAKDKEQAFVSKSNVLSNAFFNTSEAKTLAYLRSLSKKEFDSISGAVGSYTWDTYESMNAYMRGANHIASDINKKYPFTKRMVKEMKKDIKIIKEFLDKAPKYQGNLFRTQSWYGSVGGIGDQTMLYSKMKEFFQTNSVFTNKQFMSTSPELMSSFAEIKDGYKINFKILRSKSGVNIAPLNGLGQREILLPPNTRFKIIKTKLYKNIKSDKFVHREILEVTLEEI